MDHGAHFFRTLFCRPRGPILLGRNKKSKRSGIEGTGATTNLWICYKQGAKEVVKGHEAHIGTTS